MTIELGPKEMAILYGLLMLGAVFLCFSGYRIYRVALSILGFAAGFALSAPYLAFFQLSEGGIFLGQLITGCVFAFLSWRFMRLGIFIAVYHVVRRHLSTLLATMLAEKIGIPPVLYPVFAALAGGLIALLLATLVVRSERFIVVSVLSLAGGFAAVDLLHRLLPLVLPLLPADLNIDPALPDSLPPLVWPVMGIILALAGMITQLAGRKRRR
ncbi:MAG: hypothetical protein IK115_00205 [Lachnospiraceae bacterium]|nr:hypothetical protein [Lachnospiraceae bacterium]